MPPSERRRVPKFLAIGCSVALAVGCVGSIGCYQAYRWLLRESARGHVVTFVHELMAHDYAAAYTSATSRSDLRRSSVAALQSCIEATPIASTTDVICSDTDLASDGRSARVTCTLTTASGPADITVDVVDPESHPYFGFVWFSSDPGTGPAWRSDACATWSGRDSRDAPPDGRVRPAHP